MKQESFLPFSMGGRISQCRQNKNMTQDELAVRLGVTSQAVSKWERNQSLPDTAMIADICRVLEISADFLLDVERAEDQIMEREDVHIQNQIWSNLRNSLEPLELVFGKDVVSLFSDEGYTEKIMKVRERLATEGILMPVVRVKDMFMLNADEYMVLSYQRVLYQDTVKKHESVDKIIEKLENTVRERYADILNNDLICGLVANLKVRFPAAIGGIVPERISYGLLKDVMKEFMARGNGMVYLVRVIEIIDKEVRSREMDAAYGDLSVKEMVDIVCRELETEDNFWVVMQHRQQGKN